MTDAGTPSRLAASTATTWNVRGWLSVTLRCMCSKMEALTSARKVSAGADATTQPAAANAGYDPEALKIPWERWIYKQKAASDASSSEKWLGASWYGWNGPLIWWMIILTLFIVMQLTGRMDWDELLRNGAAKPDESKAPEKEPGDA